MNLVIAVRGYKTIKKQQNANFTDVTALDSLNAKVFLRIIEPLSNEFTDINDVRNVAEFAKLENYDSAIIISKNFTDRAVSEMAEQKIEHISEDYMPPFEIHELYLAIVNYANNQCQKKCGKFLSNIPDCKENVADHCKTRALGLAAKNHFEEGTVGLLKNDLKMALALNR